MQLFQGFHAQLKQSLDSGDIKESNSFLEGNGGYFISGDITNEKLHEIILSWSPFVTFEVHQTIPALKTVENLINIAKQESHCDDRSSLNAFKARDSTLASNFLHPSFVSPEENVKPRRKTVSLALADV
jgi:hypothetical protein